VKINFIIGIALFTVSAQGAILKNKFQFRSPRPTIVAIIDTGVDIYHKDLKDAIWINEGESGLDHFGNHKENNKIDDDGNGFVDDVHGWNFVDNSHDVSDENGHGTHISGIVQREFKKQIMGKSHASSLKIMVLKYYSANSKNEKNLADSNRAIQYANKMNAHVINYSGGGYQSSGPELRAIQDSLKRGIPFIAAAGNSQTNNDFKSYYPSSYCLKNMISVAASDQRGRLMTFSNFGLQTVDIAAPGKRILSTLPQNTYGVMSGTSQATAFVTGLVAGLHATQSWSRFAQLRELILSRGKFHATLSGKTKTQMAILTSERF